MVGQDITVSSLKSYIESDKLPQAILLTGIRGTGKTSIARIIANSLEINSIDVREIDGASNNSIENIRDLNSQLKIPPMMGKRKMYIIDEVHMLSNAAFNGLLKNIEEPPKHVYFILCTTEPEKVIKTIRSRCLEFQLNTISNNDIKIKLASICEQEKFSYDDEGLYEIASRSEGSLRDSISLLDLISSAHGKATISEIKDHLNILSNSDFYCVMERVYECDYLSLMGLLSQYYRRGIDYKIFISDLSSFIRDLAMVEIISTSGIKNYSEEMIEKMQVLQKKYSNEILFKMLNECYNTEVNYEKSYNKQLYCDLFIVRLVSIINNTKLSS